MKSLFGMILMIVALCSVFTANAGMEVLATIPLVQARGLLTSKTIAVMMETIQATSFLRSFFPTETSLSKYIKIEVQ